MKGKRKIWISKVYLLPWKQLSEEADYAVRVEACIQEVKLVGHVCYSLFTLIVQQIQQTLGVLYFGTW